jgi:hypothetical protein
MEDAPRNELVVGDSLLFLVEMEQFLPLAGTSATRSGLVVILTTLVVEGLRFKSQGCCLLHSP